MKKEALAVALKWGVAAVAVVLVAPFVFRMVEGVAGLAVAAAIAYAAIEFSPVFAMWVTNTMLSGIKALARHSPVETLQATYQEQVEALAKFKESISAFATEVLNFSDKVEMFKKQYPDEVVKFQGQLNKMTKLLEIRKTCYKQAQKELVLFEAEIQKASAIWDMSLAVQAMNEAAGMNDDDFMAKLKTETAIDSVQSNLNRAFAELESSLADEVGQESLQLPHVESNVLTGEFTKVKERVVG